MSCQIVYTSNAGSTERYVKLLAYIQMCLAMTKWLGF